MALDATFSGETSNSYIDLDSADAYHDIRLHNDDWFEASPEKREAALQWATRIMDNLDWKGQRASDLQALAWPRTGLVRPDKSSVSSASIPNFIVQATSEYAWELMKSDRLVDSDTKGIKEVQAGEVRVKFDKTDRATKTPVYIMQLLEPYLKTTFSNFVKLGRA